MIRIFDIFFSLLGLSLLSPILILIWLIGIFENGSPLFRQQRVGHNQKTFTLLKSTGDRFSPINTYDTG